MALFLTLKVFFPHGIHFEIWNILVFEAKLLFVVVFNSIVHLLFYGTFLSFFFFLFRELKEKQFFWEQKFWFIHPTNGCRC